MKKLKIPLVVLMTLGLLGLFACLPGIVSALLDQSGGKTPSYSDIHPVELDISHNGQELSFPDKLRLLKDAHTVELNQSQATMTEADVEAVIAAFLNRCEEAGFYEAFSPTYVAMKSKLVYDLSDPSKHLVIWSVIMINKYAPNQNLQINVDDETGKILGVQYSIYRSYALDDVWERNKTVIDRFSDLYFEQLGILEEAMAAKENPSYDTRYGYEEVDGEVSQAIYTFSDPEGETFSLQFTVDGAGGFAVNVLS